MSCKEWGGGSSPTISIKREIKEDIRRKKYARRKTKQNLKDKTHKKEIRKTYARKKGWGGFP